MSWRTAYLDQARSDYAQFGRFNRKKYAACHQLHYLQMATEKFAKSFLSPVGGDPPPRTHYAFVRFLQVTRGQPYFRKLMGFNRANQYNAFIDAILPLARRVEELAPVGGDVERANPEYPWLNNGNVISPLMHDYHEVSWGQPPMVRLLETVARLFRIVQ